MKGDDEEDEEDEAGEEECFDIWEEAEEEEEDDDRDWGDLAEALKIGEEADLGMRTGADIIVFYISTFMGMRTLMMSDRYCWVTCGKAGALLFRDYNIG